MLLFVSGEVMLFAGLLAAYVVLRFGSGNFAGTQRLPVGLTWLSTSLLVASSVMLVQASRGLKRGAMRRFKAGALAALACGIGFLGIQWFEWQALLSAGVLPGVSNARGMFYMLSWAHGLHVAGGIVLLAVLAIQALRGLVTPERRSLMAVSSIYWHFVTVVWIGLFAILFLL
jgi:cytochrome c oxidase subunit 3